MAAVRTVGGTIGNSPPGVLRRGQLLGPDAGRDRRVDNDRRDARGEHLLSPWALPPGVEIVATGDLDRDGFTDLVLQHDTTGDISWFRLDGYGQVSGASLTPGNVANLQWKIRGADDFDGDAFVDLVWQNTTTGELVVWFMTRTVVRSSAPFVPGTVPGVGWRVVTPR
jgi:hypothetical protein